LMLSSSTAERILAPTRDDRAKRARSRLSGLKECRFNHLYNDSARVGLFSPGLPHVHPSASSFCNCSRGVFLVSGTIVFTHRSWRHIMPAKNENTYPGGKDETILGKNVQDCFDRVAARHKIF